LSEIEALIAPKASFRFFELEKRRYSKNEIVIKDQQLGSV
jgi:hypothetical protein